MDLVVVVDDERGLEVSFEVLGDGGEHLSVNLLLPVDEPAGLVLGELFLLGLLGVLGREQHGVGEAGGVDVHVDLGGGDDDVVLWDGGERDLVDAEGAVDQQMAVLELPQEDGALSGEGAGEDDDDAAGLEPCAQRLMLGRLVHETLRVGADLEGLLSFFRDNNLWTH